MNSSISAPAAQLPVMTTVTPPITTPTDAEVDLEILKTVPKAFAINNAETASWLVRKVLNARRYAERVKQWAEQEQRRAAREEQTLMFLFGRQLETWASDQIAFPVSRRKSINLPSGIIGFRTMNASLQIDEEETVLSWARKHLPSAVITKVSLSRSILKDHFEKTGAVPDVGAHIEPTTERFYIR
jgi:hypothetical protein